MLCNLKGLRAIQRTTFTFLTVESHLGQGDPERLFQPSRSMITHNQHYFHIHFTMAAS